MATHLYTYEDPPRERDLDQAVQTLEQGGVLAYPTDLNWAFGCDATNTKALDRIHRLKPTHPKDRPFTLLVSSIAMAAEYGFIENSAYRLLRRAWPGPYTILLNSTRTLPRQLKDKRRVVGIRIPRSQLVCAVVERLGRPLATTSVPPLTAEGGAATDFGDDDQVLADPARFGYQVFEEFGHGLDLLLDLGHELPGLESTIVDLTTGIPEIVRRGAGDPELFAAAVGTP